MNRFAFPHENYALQMTFGLYKITQGGKSFGQVVFFHILYILK